MIHSVIYEDRIFLDVLENFRQKEGTIEKVVKIDRESNIAAYKMAWNQ